MEVEMVKKYPAMLPSYRYFDFRYANVLGHVNFVYELTAEFDDEPVLYKISVKWYRSKQKKLFDLRLRHM